MKAICYCILVMFLCLLGCARDPALFRTDHLDRVQVGEEKEFALLKLGMDFTPLVLEDKRGDKFEVMEYREKPSVFSKTRVFRVYFINNKLVGYERVRESGIIPYEEWVEPTPSLSFPGKRVQAVSLSQYFDEQ